MRRLWWKVKYARSMFFATRRLKAAESALSVLASAIGTDKSNVLGAVVARVSGHFIYKLMGDPKVNITEVRKATLKLWQGYPCIEVECYGADGLIDVAWYKPDATL